MGKKEEIKPVIENLEAALGLDSVMSSPACSMPAAGKANKRDFLKETANRVAQETGADVLFYNGPLERSFIKQFVDTVLGRNRRQQVLLIMATTGGDPDAAYLIAKCLQCNYGKFQCFVAGLCKSAGTLVAIGAHELIFSPYGELGPLDVQILKKDELGGQTSGWAINSALNTITQQASTAFDRFFVNLIYGSEGRITVQTAGKIAADLTTGLVAPICAQINPEFVGEVGRALNIANQYGRMLDQVSHNLKEKGLDRLISGYVSHGFVIDGYEAQNIFNRVSFAEGPAAELAVIVGNAVINPIEGAKTPQIFFLSDEIQGTQPLEEQHANKPGNDGRPAAAVAAQRGERISAPPKTVEPNGRRPNRRGQAANKKRTAATPKAS
ncbi:MAG: hypothetical protein HY913_23945 [Desulfomonile tiedjei]|nr:hypothetical protein [Desulfomonile tiedjei]